MSKTIKAICNIMNPMSEMNRDYRRIVWHPETEGEKGVSFVMKTIFFYSIVTFVFYMYLFFRDYGKDFFKCIDEEVRKELSGKCEEDAVECDYVA